MKAFIKLLTRYDRLTTSLRAHSVAMEWSIIESQRGRNRDALVEISSQEAIARNLRFEHDIEELRADVGRKLRDET